MKILILGASSYVGARIFFEVEKEFPVIGTYNSNNLSDKFLHLDITKEDDVNNFILKQHPDVVIHVANNASSSWCEKNKEAAVLLNQTATNYIVEAVNKINAKLIYISSVAVFEDDVYAKTKLESEKIVKQTKAGYLILEPGLILGMSPNTQNDRSFNRFLKNIDEKTEAIYDGSRKYLTTYLGHICEVILECIKRDIWNETILITNKELKTKYDVAKDVLGCLGIDVVFDNTISNEQAIERDLSKLNELNLPTYNYQTMVDKLIEEIKNRDIFKL